MRLYRGRCAFCRGAAGRRRSRSVAELARAIRQQSATAIRFWWGVSVQTVWRWRRALGVTRTSNPGSRRLIVAGGETGRGGYQGARLDRSGAASAEPASDQARAGPELEARLSWSAVDRSRNHVARDAERRGRCRADRANGERGRQKRRRLGIASVGGIVRRRWTAAELRLLRSGLHYLEIARLTNRTPMAVSVKRALDGDLRNR
jgi:hypothetical protein